MSRFRKILLRTIQVILGFILLLVAVLYITDNDYIIRGVQLTYLKGHKTANIDDYKDFDNNLILADKPQPWRQHELYNKIPLTDTLRNELERFKSIGFLWQKTERHFGNITGMGIPVKATPILFRCRNPSSRCWWGKQSNRVI